jgi:drug/metabolite transporter (DMT)-like permease
MPARSLVLLVIGVVAVGFAAIFIRYADAPSLSIAFYRNAFAAAVLLPLAIARHPGEIRGLSRRQVGIAALSGVFLALHFATWISSLALTTVAASVVLVTSAPIFTAAAGRLFFGERVDRRVMMGILLALAGTVVITGGDLRLSGRAALGDLLALAGAVAGAGYFLAGRRLRPSMSLLTYVGLVYTICAALLFVIVLAAGDSLSGFDAQTWWMLVLLALVPQILGHTTFNYLLADLDATVVAVAVMGEPVVSALLAVAFFGEVPPWTAVAGGLVLLGGIYVALTDRPGVAAERPG